MSQQQAEKTVGADLGWKGLYKAGGASQLIVGILWIIGTVIILIGGIPPTSTDAFLKYVAGQKLLFQLPLILFVLRNFFIIPGILALYVALKEVKKTYALIGSGFLSVSLVVDLSAADVNLANLVPLSDAYQAATGDIQRAAYVAAADVARGALNSGIILAVLTASIGFLIFGLAMLKGVFGKGTAYLGIVAGIVGLVQAIFLPPIGLGLIVWFVVSSIWFLAVGSRLYRLGR